MAQYFKIHPHSPQQHLLRQAVAILQRGGIMAYPTDSCYALGCRLGDKNALDQIRQLRRLSEKQHMTLMCQDLSEIASYAHVDNITFRYLKSMLPGPYTFLLRARRDVPKRLQHPNKKSIGIRVPDNRIALALLACLAEPIITSSLVLPQTTLPETEPLLIKQKIGKQLDLIIDGGTGKLDFTKIIDMTGTEPLVIREK